MHQIFMESIIFNTINFIYHFVFFLTKINIFITFPFSGDSFTLVCDLISQSEFNY